MSMDIDRKLNEIVQCVNRHITQLELLKESFVKEMQFHLSALQNDLTKLKKQPVEDEQNKANT